MAEVARGNRCMTDAAAGKVCSGRKMVAMSPKESTRLRTEVRVPLSGRISRRGAMTVRGTGVEDADGLDCTGTECLCQQYGNPRYHLRVKLTVLAYFPHDKLLLFFQLTT